MPVIRSSLIVILALVWARVATAQETYEVWEATIPELQEAMASGRVTSSELVDAYMARIQAYDQQGPRLNAIIRINPLARAAAEALDRERAENGARGPLHGIPIILKDNYDTDDMPTTAGSIALAGSVPPDDGFQVRKLREAGAVIIAKSNMHELARGITTISSLGGQTRNPYDPSRNPGGSSGGTGAAIAASFAAVGMGSDTCGSIRIPSAHHSLVGLRPTKGLSSIDGIIPLSHTQDTGGPLARTVIDLAIVLDATVGPDSADEATRILEGRALERFTDSLDTSALLGARIGILTDLVGGSTEDQEVARIVRAAIEEMEELGATAVEITIPDFAELIQGVGVINLEFGRDLFDYLAATPSTRVNSVADIVETGLHHRALEDSLRNRSPMEIDAEDYEARLERRTTVRNTVVGILDDHLLDALAYPTLRRKPARIGEPQRGSTCQLSAVSGLPALTVPAGFTDDGLPVGVELLGRTLDDARLVSLGYAFEQATHHRRPPVLTPPLSAEPEPSTVRLSVEGDNFEAEFTMDLVRNLMEYDLSVMAVPEDLYAVTLHRRGESGDGPVIQQLTGPGRLQAAGTFVLSQADREALEEGRLYLRAYTKNETMGGRALPLTLPAP